MDLENAKKLKSNLTADMPSILYNMRPLDREFFGRFELALDSLALIDDLKEHPAPQVLNALKMNLETILDVYGKTLQENSDINPVQKD